MKHYVVSRSKSNELSRGIAGVWETALESNEECARIFQGKQNETQPRNNGLLRCSEALTATRNFSVIKQCHIQGSDIVTGELSPNLSLTVEKERNLQIGFRAGNEGSCQEGLKASQWKWHSGVLTEPENRTSVLRGRQQACEDRVSGELGGHGLVCEDRSAGAACVPFCDTHWANGWMWVWFELF